MSTTHVMGKRSVEMRVLRDNIEQTGVDRTAGEKACFFCVERTSVTTRSEVRVEKAEGTLF